MTQGDEADKRDNGGRMLASGMPSRLLLECEHDVPDESFSSSVLWKIRLESWARRAARLAGAGAAGFTGMVVAHALLTPDSSAMVPAVDWLQASILREPGSALLALVVLGAAIAMARAAAD